MWPVTHSRPHRSAEQNKDWMPHLLPHPARAAPTETFSLSGGWGRGHRGKPLLPNTPICTPSVTGFLRPPACQPAITPTSRQDSLPSSSGLALQLNTLLFCIVMLRGASFIISVPLLSGRGRERGGGSWGWKEESANQPLCGF